jgi:hypothetical protein
MNRVKVMEQGLAKKKTPIILEKEAMKNAVLRQQDSVKKRNSAEERQGRKIRIAEDADLDSVNN